ncbi:hypothetical protein IWQ61_004716 [Dispira simplex]|nr:hypothetical protein IWQ61_004716 [Dispira simplex]
MSTVAISTYELRDPTGVDPQVYCPEFVSTEGTYKLKMDLSYEAIVVNHNTIQPHPTPSLAPAKYISLVSVKFRGIPKPFRESIAMGVSGNTDNSTLDITDDRTLRSGDSPGNVSSLDITLSQSLPPTTGVAQSPQGNTAGVTLMVGTSSSEQEGPKSASVGGLQVPLYTKDGSRLSPSLTTPKLPTSLPPSTSMVTSPSASSKKPDDDSSFSLFQSVRLKKRSKSSQLSKKDNSFVSHVAWNDQLVSILSQRQQEDTYFFYNSGRSFFWADLGCRPQEPLARMDFHKAVPTCHDVNLLTRSGASLDIIIGFNTGDLIWFDPITQKRCRLNQQGIINASSVTSVRWVPGSESHFMASFQDGAMVMFDKSKDDHTNFNPSFAMNPEDPLKVAKPTKTKYNPLTYWQVSKKAVTAFAFSPNCQHVAITTLDGQLRVVDYIAEVLEDTFTAYFGGLTCVCWSPDGKYILTGGQDDLITIWDFYGHRILARCQGHQSWINGVTFDPWRCDETNYRFGSVGEDTRILFWDFSVNALHRPKSAAVQLRRMSRASSTFNPYSANLLHIKHENVYHQVSLRDEVAVLEPVMSQSVHKYPVCSITFREDVVITTCRFGHIKIWARPQNPTTN